MKPILFNTEMVRAILDGRKAQTRRVIKIPSYLWENPTILQPDCCAMFHYGAGGCQNHSSIPLFVNSKYCIGDILWVRETWTYGRVVGESDEYGNSEFWLEQTQKEEDEKCIFYKADMDEAIREGISFKDVFWKPSIHMPKEHARIFLRVTNARVERLQDIETSDMLKEGVSEYKNYEEFRNNHDPRNAKDFVQARNKIVNDLITLWNSINGKGAWEENPFVFVYEFQRIEKPN